MEVALSTKHQKLLEEKKAEVKKKFLELKNEFDNTDDAVEMRSMLPTIAIREMEINDLNYAQEYTAYFTLSWARALSLLGLIITLAVGFSAEGGFCSLNFCLGLMAVQAVLILIHFCLLNTDTNRDPVQFKNPYDEIPEPEMPEYTRIDRAYTVWDYRKGKVNVYHEPIKGITHKFLGQDADEGVLLRDFIEYQSKLKEKKRMKGKVLTFVEPIDKEEWSEQKTQEYRDKLSQALVDLVEDFAKATALIPVRLEEYREAVEAKFQRIQRFETRLKRYDAVITGLLILTMILTSIGNATCDGVIPCFAAPLPFVLVHIAVQVVVISKKTKVEFEGGEESWTAEAILARVKNRKRSSQNDTEVEETEVVVAESKSPV